MIIIDLDPVTDTSAISWQLIDTNVDCSKLGMIMTLLTLIDPPYKFHQWNRNYQDLELRDHNHILYI